MAELLIKAVDYAHADPEKDRCGAYKRGDVVVVMPDGHVWGGAEGLPKFLRVSLPGVTVAEFQHTAGSDCETAQDIIPRAMRRMPNLMRRVLKTKDREVKIRRRYSIDVDALDFTGGRATVDAVSITDKRKQ
ncbi:MAG: hypothetical protein GY753_07690 [Gammaproteobacteria bacterium]|nr:hypothetical protein [Gammaproteobacteria bacterium]